VTITMTMTMSESERADRRERQRELADRLKASGALDQIFEQIDGGEMPLGGLGRGVWLPAASWSACSAYRHARTQAVASAGHPSVLTVRS
jgi:hypothetical protein